MRTAQDDEFAAVVRRAGLSIPAERWEIMRDAYFGMQALLKALDDPLTLADAERGQTRGNFERPAPAPARFKPGDRVRTRNIHPKTHTRLPRYARDKLGTVEAIRGCHVFPDTAAIGEGDHPQWLYTVVFDGRELWGEDADPTTRVSIEAFEPYLTAP